MKTTDEKNLDQSLAEADAVKAEMTRLLSELEAQATRRLATSKTEPAKPGGWRHHPGEWAADYLPAVKPRKTT